MIGTAAAVAHDAPTEFAERHADHTVLQPEQVQVVLERVYGIADALQQVGMHADAVVVAVHLLRVRVEALFAHPVDLGLQTAADQLCNDLQCLGQFGARCVAGGVEGAEVATRLRGRFDHVDRKSVV